MMFCSGLGGGCRRDGDQPEPTSSPEHTDRSNATSWFTEITGEVGLHFAYENGARGDMLMPEIMGSGVALFDFDRDGDLDIYLTNGHRRLPQPNMENGVTNRLFRQEPDGRFIDVTAVSGLGDNGYGMGVAVGDIDNDGDPDVYVTNLRGDRLYRNLGQGRFDDITETAGVAVDGWSASACFFDYDGDGFLDLYVTQYVKWQPRKKCFSPVGRPTYCGPLAFLPVHDILLHNNGRSASPQFTDVSRTAGITSVKAAGLGVVCEDLNGDGRLDVYVTNDAYANHLWINQGDGTFHDEALEMGCAYNLNGAPEAGMGVIAGDFDQDGDTDLFMTHLDEESNTLYRNLGGAMGFTDVTGEVGLARSSQPYTGFGTAAFDVELDGDLDIFLVNGRVKRGPVLPHVRMEAPWNALAQPNLFYRNDGTGRFTLLQGPTASLCDPVEITRGLATGDLDADGDIDLVITNIKGPSRIYRNDVPRQGAWLIVRAWDPRLNRDAIGARVTVVCGGHAVVRTISRSFSYLSSSDPRAHFGLGPVTRVDRIEVRWPDGLEERFISPRVNANVKLVRGTGMKP